uniref:Uncharacterized protein n=1 Tax=Oryza brachyantha TaxID=4533 RepID=J3LYM5_ORYBR
MSTPQLNTLQISSTLIQPTGKLYNFQTQNNSSTLREKNNSDWTNSSYSYHDKISDQLQYLY